LCLLVASCEPILSRRFTKLFRYLMESKIKILYFTWWPRREGNVRVFIRKKNCVFAVKWFFRRCNPGRSNPGNLLHLEKPNKTSCDSCLQLASTQQDLVYLPNSVSWASFGSVTTYYSFAIYTSLFAICCFLKILISFIMLMQTDISLWAVGKFDIINGCFN